MSDAYEAREKRYAQLLQEGYSLKNTYTTQEGCVFGMKGATCPRCEGPSSLTHRDGISGYFNCPKCGLMYDEPNFDCDEYITNVDEDDEYETT